MKALRGAGTSHITPAYSNAWTLPQGDDEEPGTTGHYSRAPDRPEAGQVALVRDSDRPLTRSAART